MIDARAHLRGLIGTEVRTLTEGRSNRILRMEGDEVMVATASAPDGRPIPMQWLQDAVDLLESEGEVSVDVETLRYRSAFIGAFLATLPGAFVRPTTPRRVALWR